MKISSRDISTDSVTSFSRGETTTRQIYVTQDILNGSNQIIL